MISFVWLTPTANFYVYFFVIGTLAVLYGRIGVHFNSRAIRSYIAISVIFIVFFLPKVTVFGSIDDLKEFAKIVLASIFYSRIRGVVRIETLVPPLLILVLLDFSVSGLQWLKIDIPGWQFIGEYLYLEKHVGALSLQSTRALGIMANPGEHGAMIFISYLLFLASFRNKSLRAKCLFGMVLCVFVMLIAQSKTTILALLISTPLLIQYIPKLEKKYYGFVGLFFIGLIFYVDIEQFEQYILIWDYGFEVSSFIARTAIWNEVVQVFFESDTFFQVIGPGRGALQSSGVGSSVFDNDFIYMLNTYGLAGVFLAFSGYLFFLYRQLRKKTKTVGDTWLLYIMICGPIIGLALDFISSPKVLFFVCIAVACRQEAFRVHLRG